MDKSGISLLKKQIDDKIQLLLRILAQRFYTNCADACQHTLSFGHLSKCANRNATVRTIVQTSANRK